MLLDGLLLSSNCHFNFREPILCGCHRFRHLRMGGRGVISREDYVVCCTV
jgi:hypothetical protein